MTLEKPSGTRQDLAQHMHTSVATVSALVRSLTERGVLVQSGSAESTGGRPASRVSISPTFGHCYAHQVLDGRLASCVIDARGKVLAKADRPVEDVHGIFRGVDAAEMELSVKVADRPPLASGIVVPGLVDRCSNTGSAPWVFGHQTFDPAAAGCNSLLVSSAGSLLAMQVLRLGLPFSGRWVALDMVSGLSGLFVTDRIETVPLEVAALDPPAEIITRCAMEAAIIEAAARRTSTLARRLDTQPPIDALVSSDAEGDEVACRIFDRLAAQTADFVRASCRVLRPRCLVICSWLTETTQPGRLGGLIARQMGMPPESVILVSPAEAIEHRWVGAGLAAFNLRLAEIETGSTLER